MKKYIKSNDEVSSVWTAIPEKYHPYISEVQVNHPYSQYQQKDVTTSVGGWITTDRPHPCPWRRSRARPTSRRDTTTLLPSWTRACMHGD